MRLRRRQALGGRLEICQAIGLRSRRSGMRGRETGGRFERRNGYCLLVLEGDALGVGRVTMMGVMGRDTRLMRHGRALERHRVTRKRLGVALKGHRAALERRQGVLLTQEGRIRQVILACVSPDGLPGPASARTGPTGDGVQRGINLPRRIRGRAVDVGPVCGAAEALKVLPVCTSASVWFAGMRRQSKQCG